jgi:chaperonin GroES
MKVKAIGEYVAVRVDSRITTDAGLHIPNKAMRPQPQIGWVTSAGDGRPLGGGERIAPEVKVGNRVAFHRRGRFTEVVLSPTEVYVVVPQGDIVAVLEEEPGDEAIPPWQTIVP